MTGFGPGSGVGPTAGFGQDAVMGIQIAHDAHSDPVLSDSPFALLLGMLMGEHSC